MTSLTFKVTTCLLFLVVSSTSAQSETSIDVLVYGATPGGCAAAIAAAREGSTVLLIEPTSHIGGLSTGGLSHCDSNQMVRETVMGIFDEWHHRIVTDYVERGLPAPYDPSNKDTSRWTFEPHVAMRVTRAMLDEAGVQIQTEAFLTSVEKVDSQIKTVTTTKGTYQAEVFIDATYEGDLMAAAGVSWVIGRESTEEFNESFAGKRYPKPRMKFSGLSEEGEPLPLTSATQDLENGKGDSKVMTYSFRLCLATDPSNQVPIPQPRSYNPERFEIIRRFLRSGGDANQVGFDLYPLPGKKLDGNNSIGRQFSIGLVGGGNTWHVADESERKEIWEAHKEYTLEFIHFLRNDPAIPASVRDRYAKLGLCRDEFESFGHFSPTLYVRESRRMRGMYVLSQKDIIDEPTKEDSIGVSSFPIDSHDVQRLAVSGDYVVNEGTIFPVRIPGGKVGYAYQVPLRSILPRSEECSNLFVPVALSCTHVGICSLRIEGAWMVIGQSAGVAAALAAKNQVAVQDLDYEVLRKRLLAQGQVLELPALPADPINEPGLLDDSEAELEGVWKKSSLFKNHVGEGYLHDDRRGDGESIARFKFQASVDGLHEIYIAYSPHETRATNVPVLVDNGNEEFSLTVDQTLSLPSNRRFRHIGDVNLKKDGETLITLSNRGTDGFVILDAIRVIPSSKCP